MFKFKGKIVMSGITLSLLAMQPSSFAEGTSPVSSAPAVAAPQPSDDVDIEVLSEAFGNFIGRNLKSPGVQFNVEKIIDGIRKGASGAPSPMSDQEYETAMMKLQEKAYEALSKENLQAAISFLAENKSKEHVVEIEPGKLQYLILTAGNGAEVQKNATPLINYKGTYIDGTSFGSSEEVGGPITIPLDQTIPGFSKGIVGMKEGEKRRLFIHPDLGYGTLGNLPPNALLIFDIEVVKADAGKESEAPVPLEKEPSKEPSTDQPANDEDQDILEIDDVDMSPEYIHRDPQVGDIKEAPKPSTGS